MSRLTTVKDLIRSPSKAKLISTFGWRLDALRHWLHGGDNWYVGKLIELRGNVVQIDGCSFTLDSPAIATGKKSGINSDYYEGPERVALQRFLDPHLPVIEFGASIGVVSCLTNRKLADPAKHVVVEASPAIVALLARNRDRNGCSFTIVAKAVAYGADRVTFNANKANFLGSSALSTGPSTEAIDRVEVATTSLKTLLNEYQFERCTLICDIEGGEADLLRNEADVIGARVDTIILEVHEWFLGKEGVQEVLASIESLGFRSVFQMGETLVFKKVQSS